MSSEKNINFTFNFNAPVGQNIAHADKVEVHFDKDMGMQIIDKDALINGNKTIEEDAVVEEDNSLDLIFHDALDMAKVKVALGDVLARKDKSGKQIFGQKNLVYVVYKFFMENDWFEKDNQAKFREWMAANYGEAFQCKKSHFDGVNEMCKRNALASWKPTWTPYITAANALNERFKGDNNPEWEKNFLKPNRYIAHNRVGK